MHQRKSDTDKLYIPRKEDRRGMIQLELFFKTTTMVQQECLHFTDEWMFYLERTMRDPRAQNQS